MNAFLKGFSDELTKVAWDWSGSKLNPSNWRRTHKNPIAEANATGGAGNGGAMPGQAKQTMPSMMGGQTGQRGQLEQEGVKFGPGEGIKSTLGPKGRNVAPEMPKAANAHSLNALNVLAELELGDHGKAVVRDNLPTITTAGKGKKKHRG